MNTTNFELLNNLNFHFLLSTISDQNLRSDVFNNSKSTVERLSSFWKTMVLTNLTEISSELMYDYIDPFIQILIFSQFLVMKKILIPSAYIRSDLDDLDKVLYFYTRYVAGFGAVPVIAPSIID